MIHITFFAYVCCYLITKPLQSWPTLCDTMDCNLSGSSVHGTLQATILEWVAIPPLQGIFPTQRLNLDLLYCRQILYCLTLCDPMDGSLPGFSVHGILQAKNTGVGCHALLQRIFPTQRSNPHLSCLLHWQADSLPLAPPGKPL